MALSKVNLPPISQGCNQSGLKGCPELTDGIVLYIEGDKSGSKKKIFKAAVKNGPKELQAFVDTLKALNQIPGVGDHMKPIMEVVAMLDDSIAAQRATQAKGGDPSRGDGAPSPSKTGASTDVFMVALPDNDVLSIRTLTVMPANDTRAKDCGTSVPIDGMAAKCITVRLGPFIITNIVGGQDRGRCQLFVGSGELRQPLRTPDVTMKWVIFSPFNVNGGRLRVRGDRRLIVGVVAADKNCWVTISGFNP